jgi:hypothetical protein
MPDTLLAAAEDDLEAATDEEKRAKKSLETAQTDLAEAQKDLAEASQELAKLQDGALEIRRKIAATANAAEGQKLFEDLDANLSERRAKQVVVADAQDAIADARGRIAAEGEDADRSTAAARAAEAAKVEAAKAEALHAAWLAKATAQPLAGTPGRANVANAGPAKTAKTAAENRLKADVTSELFARAQDRRSRRVSRLDDIEGAAAAAGSTLVDETAKTGLAGKTAKARLAYELRVAELRQFALTGMERYERALMLLERVKNAPLLSPEEVARIDELRDAAVAANAFTLEEARDDARDALAAQEVVIATEVLNAVLADPEQDPEDAQKVKDERAKVQALEQTLASAQNAYNAEKPKLDALEAAVPESTWALFDDYEEALALLDDLAGVNPAGLGTALEAAEDAYAVALRADREAARTILVVGELARVREGRVAAVEQARPARLLAALRGDD